MRKYKKLVALVLTAAMALSLSMTAFAAVEDTGFSDVNADVWYTNAVAYVTENNLMDPIGTNHFSPDTDATRPAISGHVSNMDRYDVVFIGCPIWWGEAPRIVSTFVESYNFSGKTIVPFCTSGSSGIGSSARNLSNLTNGANWLEGRRFGGGTSRNTMIDWVNGLGLNVTAQ